MTESTEEKTKRKYLKMLNEYRWSYQYSIFYDDAKDSCRLLNDMAGFKQALRSKYPNTAFLIRIQSHRKRWTDEAELQAFLMILSTSLLPGIRDQDFLNRHFSAPVNVSDQKISEWKLQSIYRAVAKQAAHKLHKVFTEHASPIKRFSILNKEKLVERPEKLMETTE